MQGGLIILGCGSQRQFHIKGNVLIGYNNEQGEAGAVMQYRKPSSVNGHPVWALARSQLLHLQSTSLLRVWGKKQKVDHVFEPLSPTWGHE